jgi:hypothetical protein
MGTPFANYRAQQAAFGKDPIAAKKLADAAKGKHRPVYTGESKASIMANTPGHPHQTKKGKVMSSVRQDAIQRRLEKKRGKVVTDTNPADDKVGMKDNPADDVSKSPVGKSKGGGAMNAGFKAYLAAHKKN